MHRTNARVAAHLEVIVGHRVPVVVTSLGATANRCPGGALDSGRASSIPVNGDVDLVLCTGNTIMHLSGEDLTAALRQVIGGLRPEGVVSFECRSPARREWERWTREATLGSRDTSLGRLTEWIEVIDLTVTA